MFPNLEKLLDSFLAAGVPGYDVMICRGGEIIYRRQKGFSDLENRVPVQGDERYNFYSCSKPITVTAAMTLYDEGRFRLDDELAMYLPEFAHMTVKTPDGVRPVKTPITLRHLFSMQAGFNYDLDTPALLQARKDTHGLCPTRETVAYLARQPLDFEPGTRYGYSLCHDVLAAVVEVISGEKYQDFVKRRVFDVLGMSHSTFLLPQGERSTLAQQYRFDPLQGRAVNCGPDNPYLLGAQYAAGGAGLVSTTEDYMRFVDALRAGEKLVRRETLKLMTTDQLSDTSREVYGFREHHGYGLGLRCPYPGLPATDFGWDGAAGSIMAVFPQEDVSFLYVQHLLDSPCFGRRFEILDAVKADLSRRPLCTAD